MYIIETNYKKVTFVYDVDQFNRLSLELLFKDNLVIRLFENGNNVNFNIIISHDFAPNNSLKVIWTSFEHSFDFGKQLKINSLSIKKVNL